VGRVSVKHGWSNSPGGLLDVTGETIEDVETDDLTHELPHEGDEK
jgi:hypothetical protein